MKFCWITLRVDNMEDSLQFYNEVLGLPISMRHSLEDLDIVMLGDTDKTKIELLYDKNNPVANRGEGISIGLEVDSLDTTVDYLKEKQITILRGPISPNPHVRFCFIKDPNGVEVQLVENK